MCVKGRSTIDFGWHKIGGRLPDGRGNAIGAWTFETPQVRSIVESYLEGKVLNACAGKTHLRHDGEVHRNDIDRDRDVDTHFDVQTIDERFPLDAFDTVVFDPPFDREQGEEHYNGHYLGRGPTGGFWQARRALVDLCAPGGRIISLGWNSVGCESFTGFEREAIHLFQRASQLADVILVVDRNIQHRLTGNSRQGSGRLRVERDPERRGGLPVDGQPPPGPPRRDHPAAPPGDARAGRRRARQRLPRGPAQALRPADRPREDADPQTVHRRPMTPPIGHDPRSTAPADRPNAQAPASPSENSPRDGGSPSAGRGPENPESDASGSQATPSGKRVQQAGGTDPTPSGPGPREPTPPICHYCGTPIPHDHRPCPALSRGYCRP